MADLPTIRVIQFKTEYKMKDGKSVEEHWCEYAPVGAVTTSRVWARIKELRPPDFIRGDDAGAKMAFLQNRWAMIEPAYNAWIAGHEIPLSGTPLGSWPGITREQTEALRMAAIRTVEEVAAMVESQITRLPLPNARELPKLARAFLEAADQAKAASDMKKRDETIAEMQEKIDALTELLRNQASTPKRGRPATEEAA